MTRSPGHFYFKDVAIRRKYVGYRFLDRLKRAWAALFIKCEVVESRAPEGPAVQIIETDGIVRIVFETDSALTSWHAVAPKVWAMDREPRA